MTKRNRNSFTTPLVVEVMQNGKTFKVARQFTYLWKRGYIEIHVPVGFVTDFASIPRFARMIIPKLGKYTKAAVVHDFIYATPSHCTRERADQIFRDGMEVLGVVPWKRFLMYWSVRLGGWLAWRKK